MNLTPFSLSLLRPMRSAFQFLLRDIFPSFYFYSDSSFDRQDFVVSVCVCLWGPFFNPSPHNFHRPNRRIWWRTPAKELDLYMWANTTATATNKKRAAAPNKRGQLCRFPTLVETLYGCCSVWLSIDLDQHHSINKRIVASSLSPFWGSTLWWCARDSSEEFKKLKQTKKNPQNKSDRSKSKGGIYTLASGWKTWS